MQQATHTDINDFKGHCSLYLFPSMYEFPMDAIVHKNSKKL